MLLYFCSHLLKNDPFPVPEEAGAYEELFAMHSDRTHIPSYLETFIYSLLGYCRLQKFDYHVLFEMYKASRVILPYQSLIP